MLNNTIAVMQSERDPLVDGHEARRSLTIEKAIYSSAQRQEEVAVSQSEQDPRPRRRSQQNAVLTRMGDL